MLPQEFIYLPEVDDTIQYDIKYATNDNLVGRVIAGYKVNVCICTKALAQALSDIQKELRPSGLALFIYETYRPKQAGDDLYAWSQDLSDQVNKAQYYPHVNKADFYQLGYIVRQSTHTRGSTVDLTLLDLATNQPLDMGTDFDFMDPLSYPDNQDVSKLAYENRQFLRQLMLRHGFSGIVTEWWHFSLLAEPFPETYFDFPVK